jgi:diaminopimelate epimerase
MDLRFTKMHGLGNDFVVIDGVRQSVALSTEQVRRLANRRLGVGCDQVLVVEKPDNPAAAFRYRIYNADGGEVEQCGNGARCFARFVRDQGLTELDVIPVETSAGLIELRLQADGQVRVNMGRPRFEPADIPFDAPQRAAHYALALNGKSLDIGAVSMGNPHAVLLVPDVENAHVEELGPWIESHARFPKRVNVGFMQLLDRGHIRLRVFERGAGETLACGTGACAAVAVGIDQGLLDAEVDVALPGGHLVISWAATDQPVMMTGPATTVFEGRIAL